MDGPSVLGITPETLAPLSDRLVRELHDRLHAVWAADNRGIPFPDGLNVDDIINRHAFVIAQMKRRSLAHAPAGPVDSLDRETFRLKGAATTLLFMAPAAVPVSEPCDPEEIEIEDPNHPGPDVGEIAIDETPRSFPTFQVPDPTFVLDRLKSNAEVIFLSSLNHAKSMDLDHALVNKLSKPGDESMAWGVVTFTQEPETIASVSALGARADNLDPVTRKEFTARPGPFYVMRLRLVREIATPVKVKTPPVESRFGPPVPIKI